MITLPKPNADGSYSLRGGMAIDADGANGQTDGIPVYAPKDYPVKPLDFLANAGGPGNWYGIVTDSKGIPVIQGPHDPAPGAYVSATSYRYPGKHTTDPCAYVDSVAVPYIVVPSHWRKAIGPVVLGCRALVTELETKKTLECAVLDFGPRGKFGEASIAVARYFGVPWSPRTGGTVYERFIYTIFPGIAAKGFELQPV